MSFDSPPDVDWQSLPADPDLQGDLDYAIDEWDVVRARKHGDRHLMFLPRDEELLREDAFILADTASVCDVERRQ